MRLVPLLLALLSVDAVAEEWQWRAAAGAQVDADPHGVLDLGLRRGPIAIQLLTDTLDVRYEPATGRGRYWIAGRGEAAVAGLLLSPWRDGAQDPARRLFASYGGVEGGFVRYLPQHFYAGAQGSARVYFFQAVDAARVAPVPPLTPLLTIEAVAGHYTDVAHVWLRVGADVQGLALQPRLAVEARYHPAGRVAPRLALRAGCGYRQSDLTRTRLGGITPYVVPLAGAAWAEWWVENYLAARIGAVWSTPWSELGLAADAAVFDGQIAAGFALLARAHYRRWLLDTTLGYAPFIPRQEGVSRFSLFVLLGAEWGGFRRR